jgi:hypothetical protein
MSTLSSAPATTTTNLDSETAETAVSELERSVGGLQHAHVNLASGSSLDHSSPLCTSLPRIGCLDVRYRIVLRIYILLFCVARTRMRVLYHISYL